MKMYRYLIFFVIVIGLVPGQSKGMLVVNPPKEAVQVYDIRCQYISQPAGVDNPRPVFSWKLSAVKRNIRQTAYHIVVASSPEKLDKHPDIWNSGKVTSTQNAFVQYEGKPLESARKYYWKIKIWDNEGKESTWSNTSYFITGFLKQSDWENARWISYEKLQDSLRVFPGIHGSGNNLGNKAVKRAVIPYFRKNITLDKPVSDAFVYISGQGQYAFFMNGARVDSGFLNPAWSDYTKRCYYNSFEVTRLLKQGENTLGALAGTGFFYINRERYRKLVIAAGYPMIRMKLVVRYTDGTTATFVTDESWKTAPSPITYSSVYGGEDYDARQEKDHWSYPDFQDRAWKHALIVPGPGGKMQAQQSPPIHVDQAFTAVSQYNSGDTMQVYDFAQNASGIIRLRLQGPKGYQVKIIPSELINENGTPDQRASGQPYYYTYTLKGSGVESWQPVFSYYGLRYAGVVIKDAEGNTLTNDQKLVKIQKPVFLHTETAVPQVGTFSCSDTLFNKIFELIRWGIRNNMSNVATDCPHREKLGWLEETHLMGNSIQYNYGIRNFYSKIIEDMQDAQLSNGLVPDIAPEYVEFDGGFRDSPEWGSAGVLLPWYIYQWYGDTSVLRESYGMMKKYVNYLTGKADQHLLAYGLGDWFDLGPKQPGVSQLTPLGVTATGFYFYDTKILSKVARLLGDEASAKQYELLADAIRKAFNKKYFNAGTKVYATGSQTSYSIPLYFGIVEDQHRGEVFNNLVRTIKENGNALTAGDIGFRYVMQALEEGGAGQLIYEMNNRSDVPGYGYQIRHGATALTESWRALKNVSNDHMMLGHLMEWLYSGLGGIRQQEDGAGFKKILIAPQFVNGINWVNTTYNSINGPIAVKWKRTEAGSIELKVKIPANTTAKIVLPVIDSGNLLEHRKPLRANQNGINRVIKDQHTTIIETGSGEYDFSFVPETDHH